MVTLNEKPKILMVDDKPENLIVLEKLLASLDVDLYKANSGNEALSLTLEHDFVLILLDVQMPGMDGYEVLDLLSWDERTKYIPVIFITANYADEKHQIKGYEYGAVDYLFKPVDKQILLGKVKVFLELHEQKQQFKHLKQRYELILDSAGEGVIGLNLKGEIDFSNPAAAKLLELEADQLLHQPLSKIFIEKNKDGEAIGWQDSEIFQTCSKGEVLYKDDDRFQKADKEELPVEYTATPINDEKGHFSGVVLMFSDITLRKTVEAQLTHMALYDHLTQLPNRILFEKSINHSLARAERHKRLIAVMFLDLDHFKNINDTLGHDIGDLLLNGVAERLKTCVRESDTVARLGGDEFAIVLDEIEHAEDASIVAEKIIDVLKPPFNLNNHEVFASTSIGIAVYPVSGTDSITLTKNADIAMYRAKHQGRNNYCFFSSGMNKQSRHRLNLAHDLRDALERNELFLCYQPIFNLQQKKVTRLEALLRWDHPQLGIISPAEFIPIAEEISMMVPIGEWVLKTACLKSKEWFETTPSLKNIAINISASQLSQGDIIEPIEKALSMANINPHCLQLEMTESAIMTNQTRFLEVLLKIKERGIHLAIDDFGTGYSSLSYLNQLPIDTLKIDYSFVKQVPGDTNSATVIKSIISIAHNMGLNTIAEGVESQEQLDFFQQHHCDEIQGYFYSKPLTADEMTVYLRNLP